MPNPRPARTITASIAAPYDKVYGFVSDARSLPEWAHGLGAQPRPLGPNRWELVTNGGSAEVEFAPPNAFGVVDHVVIPRGGGAAVDVPLRVLKNGDASGAVYAVSATRNDGRAVCG